MHRKIDKEFIMRLKNIISIFVCCLLLSACSTAKLETINTNVDRTKLELPNPPAITLNGVDWIVVTPDNIEEILNSLGDGAVLIALTPDGYKNLSNNQLEIRTYLQQLQDILEAYRDYYERN